VSEGWSCFLLRECPLPLSRDEYVSLNIVYPLSQPPYFFFAYRCISADRQGLIWFPMIQCRIPLFFPRSGEARSLSNAMGILMMSSTLIRRNRICLMRSLRTIIAVAIHPMLFHSCLRRPQPRPLYSAGQEYVPASQQSRSRDDPEFQKGCSTPQRSERTRQKRPPVRYPS